MAPQPRVIVYLLHFLEQQHPRGGLQSKHRRQVISAGRGGQGLQTFIKAPEPRVTEADTHYHAQALDRG